ncbi:unnamed protein product [Ranitomeya imitator]|uniref:Uncharacterized protein n=1 Tax=Ranitomeya imitator TaxID=111125 RepID=A0ABN9LAY1_9NEOB|nr:unnamed protein product [Ranitomeya imitator]
MESRVTTPHHRPGESECRHRENTAGTESLSCSGASSGFGNFGGASSFGRQAGQGPGFWTGLGTGGVLGYLFGNQRKASPQHDLAPTMFDDGDGVFKDPDAAPRPLWIWGLQGEEELEHTIHQVRHITTHGVDLLILDLFMVTLGQVLVPEQHQVR